MKEIIIKFVSIILIISSVFLMQQGNASQTNLSTQKTSEKKQQKIEKQEDKIVSLLMNNQTTQLPLEEYLFGVVASEMPYTFELEALKAQAVAARTYVLQRNLQVDATTSSQVYQSNEKLMEIFDEKYNEMEAKIKQAIDATKGEVLLYDNEYISALFYSSNNGKSNDASWYYKNEVPYLKSVDSPWDLNFDKTKASEEKSLQEAMRALNVSDFTIKDIVKYDNGYVKTISIGGKTFTGREVREKLKLRSSCFTLQVQGDSLLVNTTGFGHGVGMSQYGAQGMALEGSSYQSILTHYYQGVTIKKV